MNIIFDMDGTIWDTRKVIKAAWNDVFIENNFIKIEDDKLTSLMGLTMTEIINEINLTEDILDKLVEKEHEYLLEASHLCFKNSLKAIKELSKDNRLFIVSNCQNGYIDIFLEKYSMKAYFEDFLCWGDTHDIKGETIKRLMKSNNLDSAVYVGDTTTDQEACIYADIPFIYAKYGFGDVKGYEYAVNDIIEVKDIIEKINPSL